jgi:predicted transcriptional regulator
MPTTKALTIRLPADLHRAVRELARRRQTSVSALVQEGLSALLKADQEARLYAAFGQLGEDAAEADVDYALPAFWEVLEREDA